VLAELHERGGRRVTRSREDRPRTGTETFVRDVDEELVNHVVAAACVTPSER